MKRATKPSVVRTMLTNVTLHSFHAKIRRVERRVRPNLWRAFHPGIAVGSNVRIGRGCRLFLDPDARLVLGDGCEVDDGTTIAVYGDGLIELGPGSFVGHHCTLAAREAIRLGPRAYLAELVSIRDHDHAVGEPPSSGRVTINRVEIGPDTWLGAKVTVLKGATVGERAVVGANAVVRGELPPLTVCVGVPARVVRSLDPVPMIRFSAT
jgi:acetyltransferase-like isoleucine patch superfamily enzyme